jgi:MFS superfamily sulfate permease-like transporter
VLTPTGVKYVVLFALIGTIESALSAQAIDMIDPQRRKTDLNRDILAVGVANTVSSTIGALPMISEIVRSAANVNNGAQTRKANLFHGLFLLLFVALLPGVIRAIPLPALGAMLVYTGYRLAAPAEFLRVSRIGWSQLAVFAATIGVTLATDQLIGLAAGVAFELVLHWLGGAPIRTLVVPVVRVGGEAKGQPVTIAVGGSAVFSTWLSLKRRIDAVGPGSDVVVDLSGTRLVDHTVMEKLHQQEKEFASQGRSLHVAGLEHHAAASDHPHAPRRRRVLGPPAAAGPA